MTEKQEWPKVQDVKLFEATSNCWSNLHQGLMKRWFFDSKKQTKQKTGVGSCLSRRLALSASVAFARAEYSKWS